MENKLATRLKNCEEGFIELKTGVYLWTKESIMDDQLSWLESDPDKYTDLSMYPYWITAITNKMKPQGFESLKLVGVFYGNI